MLSAQAQDNQVNIATKKLFSDHKKISDYASMKPSTLYKYVNSIGLYRNKSKNIIKTAKAIIKDFNSEVPQTIEELTSLPGVGRKTANIVIYNWFGKNEGIAIDTHCITVCNRLCVVDTKNPKKIEEILMQNIDKKYWGDVTHLFIALGRDTCTARKKYCSACVLKNICPSSEVVK